ncbi:MAG: arsenite methyltransferase [Thermoplasmatales archaeon]|nr:MAG: arsenite methyltransferase [Thermoplasmatales archaeon]
MDKDSTKKIVRLNYAKIASKENKSCCASANLCCGTTNLADDLSKQIGYSDKELKEVPDGSNLGLGCGNPVALASLKVGETVLDLGSGAGIDCFLAAKRVGKNGKIIGVDMTPEMIWKAKENAEKGKFENVEFRLGEIENLPVDDSSVDVVISNCVINLSPDKKEVFKETFRVLKPGGRLMISDIVLLKGLPDKIKESVEAYVGCVSGAMLRDEYIKVIKEVGFQDIKIIEEVKVPQELFINDTSTQTIIEDLHISPKKAKEVINSIRSIKVQAIKPKK